MSSGGGMLKDERRKKRKELKAQLDQVKKELEVVEIKIAKCKAANNASARGGAKKNSFGNLPGGGAGRGGAGGGGGGGVKRKASDFRSQNAPESKEARRQVVMKERGRRVQSLWGQCGTILKQLKQNKNAWPFHLPVDWRALNIPDYPRIVQNPMDIQTVAEKLGGFDAKCKEGPRVYKSPLEFRNDLRLIFDNCRLYNPVGSDVRIMGDALADLFEKKWQNSNIEGKFALELEYQKKEDEDLKNFVPGAAGASSYMATAAAAKRPKPAPAAYNQYMETEVQKAKPKKSKSSLADDPYRDMTFEDKRKLSVNLGKLPAEKLGRVVQIINEGPAKIDNSEDEVELDIDKMDNETLWKLEKYVTSCLKGSKKSSHQDKIQRMQQQQQETARKLEDVNATLASRSAGAADRTTNEFSPVSSKRQATVDKGSDSSDSESESAEGVGSDGDMKKHSSLAGDVTRVSTTRPQSSQPQILKDAASNREVNIKNAAAWETLTTTKDATDGDEKQKAGEKNDPKTKGTDNTLWSEFQSREQQMKAREKSKEEQAEQMRLEREKAQEEREKQIKLEEERKEKEAQQKLEKEKQEMEDLKRVEKANVEQGKANQDIAKESRKIIREQAKAGNKNILGSLGLSMKEDEEDSFDEEEDVEEGEL